MSSARPQLSAPLLAASCAHVATDVKALIAPLPDHHSSKKPSKRENQSKALWIFLVKRSFRL